VAALTDDAPPPPFGPLVSVRELATLLGEPDTRIVDCRWSLGDTEAGRRNYTAGHIPGAIYASLDDDLAAPTGPGRHPLPDPEDFAGWLGRSGIGPDHRVVAYDDAGGAIAARLWWMLRAIGYRRVAVLEGGLQAWERGGQPLSTDPPQFPHTEPQWAEGGAVVDRDDLIANLGDVQLVDARDPERFRGDSEPIDPVAGHIPTAVNLPHRDNLDTTGRFLSPDMLRRRFTAAGLDPGEEVVVYCGSGVTACHDILAMEIAGFDKVTLYPGSWSDWCTAGYPVEISSQDA
jgi:thiosulfate/3-mercaptopyruvate sulfurtransferase